jgi:hypothetical protein
MAGPNLRLPLALATTVVALLVAPAAPAAVYAQATRPAITAGPVIAGTPQVGATLTANATWTGTPEPTAAWRWQRCAGPGSCPDIAGATAATYVATTADVGFSLRVRLDVRNSAGARTARSVPTVVVTTAPPPPPPAPTPDPTPTPEPAATPTPQPGERVAGTPAADPSPAGASGPYAALPGAPALRLLRPFPLVRIRGKLMAGGARITLFSVRAPAGVRILVRCRGGSCPVRRLVRTRRRAGTSRLRAFERRLRAGTTLRVAITKPGFVGKSTVIVIRSMAAPRRVDRCLVPGPDRVERCPGS